MEINHFKSYCMMWRCESQVFVSVRTLSILLSLFFIAADSRSLHLLFLCSRWSAGLLVLKSFTFTPGFTLSLLQKQKNKKQHETNTTDNYK